MFEAAFVRFLARCQAPPPGPRFRFKGKLYSLDAFDHGPDAGLVPLGLLPGPQGSRQAARALDHGGYLLAFVHLSEGRRQEIQWARTLELPADSLVVFDRGFTDYRWWKSLTDQGIRFVTRLERNSCYVVAEERNVTWKQNTT